MLRWKKAPKGRITDNFAFNEAACNCCGRIIDEETIKKTAAMMEIVRVKLGHRPIFVSSWCRCPAHNTRVGGAKKSYHLKGMAVDFTVKGMTPAEVQAKLEDHPGGLGSYPGFTHVDIGPKRRWDD